MSVSRKLVLGCFCMVSSWASKAFRYWICCGDGTGIRLGSLLFCCFCWANDCSCRPNTPSNRHKYQLVIIYY